MTVQTPYAAKRTSKAHMDELGESPSPIAKLIPEVVSRYFQK